MRGEVRRLLLADGVAMTAADFAPSTRVEVSATGWTGTETTNTYDVSAYTDDARELVWCLKDSAAEREQINAEIDCPTATTVRVTVGIPLDSGTYYLVGV